MGNNKKRKRGEVDGLDDDDNEGRRKRLMEERLRQRAGLIENGDDAEEMILAAVNVANQLREEQDSKRKAQLAEDEELSEEEAMRLNDQDEAFRIKKTLATMDRKDLARYNSLKQKERNEDARIEQQINDLNMNDLGSGVATIADSKGRGTVADQRGRVVQSGNVKTITNSIRQVVPNSVALAQKNVAAAALKNNGHIVEDVTKQSESSNKRGSYTGSNSMI